MKPFKFHGTLGASKSILNRLLVIQSFQPMLDVGGDSKADDVVKMKSALRQLLKNEPADCGAAGTTLRFLALRASRLKGTHHLSGSLRLFERPHDEIARVVAQLGCEAELRLQRLTLRGSDWKEPSGEIVVDRSVSSQFASAVLLNAWNLPFDLRVRFEGLAVSEPYLRMTMELLKRAGMALRQESNGVVVVPRDSTVTATALVSEIDVSSAFAVAALAVASCGEVELENWPSDSLQPDAIFASLLGRMGASVQRGTSLRISRAPSTKLIALTYDVADAPDLFPVLAVLCCLADGTSRLSGAPHLQHKESDRIAKVAELIKALGRKVKAIEGGLEIEGRDPSRTPFPEAIAFDTDHDHRLAMAAAVAQAAGAKITISDRLVVAKSFPGFWELVEAGFSQ